MTNYFAFFDLPISPNLDQTELKKRFYANSRRFHPDFFTMESEAKQAEILELSTLNNQAYKALQNDQSRLQHLLELKGALAEEGQNQVPQDFLMEVMDINEALMELEMEEDPSLRSGTIAAIQKLQEEIKADVAPIMAHYDDKTASEIELKQLAAYYLKQRYLVRILEKIKVD